MIPSNQFAKTWLVALWIVSCSGLCFVRDSLTQTDSPRSTQRDSEVYFGSLEKTYRELRANRIRQISNLHEYAAGGTFPTNTDFPGRLVPYFVDKLGTACAVGHLMRLDGERELVNHIAATTNHIRIQSVKAGPMLDWVHDSGLTQEECALIQPSYACIEDYRQGSSWQEEVARLKQHFAQVEQTLINDSQRSLCKALLTKVDDQIAKNPDDPALSIAALTEALRSDEANVRIAAIHTMAKLSKLGREPRLTGLFKLLSDSDPTVRFWSAVAIEKIGAASARAKKKCIIARCRCSLTFCARGPAICD